MIKADIRIQRNLIFAYRHMFAYLTYVVKWETRDMIQRIKCFIILFYLNFKVQLNLSRCVPFFQMFTLLHSKHSWAPVIHINCNFIQDIAAAI